MAAPSRPVREGLVVGTIAYAAVAVFYALFDLLAARGPLYTVNQLGRAVFRGARDPASLGLPLPIDASAIVLYTVLHLAVSLAIGLLVVALVAHSRERPARAPMILVVIIAGFVVTIGAVGFATIPLRAVLPWWSIIVANAVAVMLGARYVMRRYPRAFHDLTDPTG